MKALILIGGMGTRLRPLTCNTPKPLMPIVNKPFLYYQLNLIKQHGIKDVIFCVSYMPESFKNHFKDGRKLGLRITYIYEKIPLGTGGAIKNAQSHIHQPVVVFNGDILTDISITEMKKYHENHSSAVTIALTRVKDPTAYGLIETDKKGKIERFLEKPSWDEVTCNTINAGTYIFQPSVLDYIPEGINYSVERGLFPLLLEKNIPLYGFVYNQYWLDVGTTGSYLQAHADLLEGRINFKLPGKKIKNNLYTGAKITIGRHVDVSNTVVCGDKVQIDDYVQLIGAVSIGNNCIIKKGAVIEHSVILNNCVIGEGVRLEYSIVGNHCIIEPHALLQKGTVVGDGSIIKRYSRI